MNDILDYGKNGYYFTADCEFISNYHKLFEVSDWSEMKAFAVNAANRISSSKFGAGIEHIYIDAVNRKKEVQDCEEIHAVPS